MLAFAHQKMLGDHDILYRPFLSSDQKAVWELYQTGVGLYDHIPVVGECYDWYLKRRLQPDGDMSNIDSVYCSGSQNSNSGFWIAECGDCIVGCVGAVPSTHATYSSKEGYVELVRMIVHNEYRNRSIGRGLVQIFENWAKSVGYKAVCLLTFKALEGPIALYSRCGYLLVQEEEVDMSDKVVSIRPAFVTVVHYIKHIV